MSAPDRWRRALQQAALLAAVAVLPAAGARIMQRSRALPTAAVNAPTIGADGMIEPSDAAGLGAAVMWIDARPKRDFERSHIPGAVLLNEDEWDSAMPTVAQEWTPVRKIVVYCDGGPCQASKQVAARLRDAGLSPVYVLRGGWPEWQRQLEAATK